MEEKEKKLQEETVTQIMLKQKYFDAGEKFIKEHFKVLEELAK